MFEQLRHPATVLAGLALFGSVTGGAYAAKALTGSDIKNSSLTGADVKNSSLTGSDVKNSSLTGSDVKNSSLTTSDIKNGTIKAGDLAPGVLTSGPAGPAGLPGLNGATGATGPRGADGTRGGTGTTGPAGSDGEDGATGPAGPRGADGGTGPRGATGDTGPRGATGTSGTPGAPGTPGIQGPAGPGTGDGLQEYGVAKAYILRGGTVIATLGTLWTSDVPDDGNNAAQAAATVTNPVALQQGDVIRLTGAVRSAEANGGHMGAGIVVTAGGNPIAGGQTAQSTTPPNAGTATVAVPRLPLTSNGPTSTDDTLVEVTIPGAVPANAAVITGTVQAFDFNG